MKRRLRRTREESNEKEVRSHASQFGEKLGAAFERAVVELIRGYLEESHSDYELLKPEGTVLITLDMPGGSRRQMDTIIAPKNSDDPVALLEAKWLKDARHHNDKGAWILQLKEMKKKHSTVRGGVAILAGYWTEGAIVLMVAEGGLRVVHVATDEQVYGTLQGPLDRYLGKETFQLDAQVMRRRYPYPARLARFITKIERSGELDRIAKTWLTFRQGGEETPTGADKVKYALDDLLAPLPPSPSVERFEVTLQIDTGNTIYEQFTDVEEALEFIQSYYRNPAYILERITPKRRRMRPGDQTGERG